MGSSEGVFVSASFYWSYEMRLMRGASVESGVVGFCLGGC